MSSPQFDYLVKYCSSTQMCADFACAFITLVSEEVRVLSDRDRGTVKPTSDTICFILF